MLSPINLEKRASIKETMNKIINQGKIKSPTIEKIANKTSYFTPKNYIIKKNKLFNSKENTKKEYSLFSSSTDSNFVNKSTTLKDQFSVEQCDLNHEKRLKDYFSDKSSQLQNIRILEILTKNKTKQKIHTENTLQLFIHKNFNEDMPDRLKTFEKFAFSNVERDEHKYIKPILSEIKTFKEPHGTMLITDLWSKNLQKECLEKSNMFREKKMLEKYLFYKNKSKKLEKHGRSKILPRNNEQILMNELSNINEKNPSKNFNIKKTNNKKIFEAIEENNLKNNKKMENILDLLVNLNKENISDKKDLFETSVKETFIYKRKY